MIGLATITGNRSIAGHWRTAREFEAGGPSAYEVVMNASFDKDLYAVLGVSPDASLAVIREARTRLLKRYHPDKGGDSETVARTGPRQQPRSTPLGTF